MFQLYILVSSLLIMLNSYSRSMQTPNIKYSGYEIWAPPNQPDNELYCPETCKREDRCCHCEAKRCWEINATACGISVGELYIEYIDIFGTATVIHDLKVNTTFYELEHSNGHLATIPENICEWNDTTVTINLSNNRLNTISGLACMVKLDILILDGNRIKYIENNTFSNMTYLRKLSMSGNSIERLDLNVFSIKSGNIFTIDMSNNTMESVDVSNIFRNGSFCLITYENSSVQSTTNELNSKVSETTVFGPGYYNFNKTEMQTFINFSLLGIEDYSDIGKRIKGRFYFDQSSVHCDCNLHPLFDSLGKAIYEVWGNVQEEEFICESPESMKGFNLSNIFETNSVDQLICNISVNCPRYCRCIDIPREKVLVNCSGAGLSTLPDFMPVGLWNNAQVDLRLDNNNIKNLENREYLHRLINLDMSSNTVNYIDPTFARSIDSSLTVNIEHQSLTSLPRDMFAIHPRNFKFGTNSIICNCENLWIGEWMRAYDAKNVLFCQTEKSRVDSAFVSAETLECQSDDTEHHPFLYGSLSFIAVLFLLFVLGQYKFRLELLILKRKYFRRNVEANNLNYDIFFVFCEQNDEVFKLVRRYVSDYLPGLNYSVFCPWFHVDYGTNREQAVIEAAQQSCHYIVCLCDIFQSDAQAMSDFNKIWEMFKGDSSKKITVLNVMALKTTDIKDPRLKAFRRVRDDLDYKYTEDKLLKRLQLRLGPPRVNPVGEKERQYKQKKHSVRIEPITNYGRDIANQRFSCRNELFKSYSAQQKMASGVDNVQRGNNVHYSSRKTAKVAGSW